MEKLVDLNDRHMVEGVPSEDQEQLWLFQWAARHGDQRLRLLFAVPNGGHRSKSQASLLKLTGVKSGVLDTMLPVPFGGYPGLFIEMKKTKGSVTSDDQEKWKGDLQHQGYRAEICKGFDEARVLICGYLGIEP